jgi:hypothetical protein
MCQILPSYLFIYLLLHDNKISTLIFLAILLSAKLSLKKRSVVGFEVLAMVAMKIMVF